MKPAELTAGASRLFEALRTLRQRWEETKPGWNDRVREKFEERHLAPLEPQVLITLERMNRLAQSFTQARQECS